MEGFDDRRRFHALIRQIDRHHLTAEAERMKAETQAQRKRASGG